MRLLASIDYSNKSEKNHQDVIMNDNMFFLVRSSVSRFKARPKACRLRLGVASENQYLTRGLSYIMSGCSEIKFDYEIVQFDRSNMLLALTVCDMLILDAQGKTALFLLADKCRPSRSFYGCDIHVDDFMKNLHLIFDLTSGNFNWVPLFNNEVFTVRERELISLLWGGMCHERITKTGKFNIKEISLYKQRVKNKSCCKHDIQLFTAFFIAKKFFLG